MLTSIGHERDNRALDKVAYARYDTPSKVITVLEQRLVKLVSEINANFEQMTHLQPAPANWPKRRPASLK